MGELEVYAEGKQHLQPHARFLFACALPPETAIDCSAGSFAFYIPYLHAPMLAMILASLFANFFGISNLMMAHFKLAGVRPGAELQGCRNGARRPAATAGEPRRPAGCPMPAGFASCSVEVTCSVEWWWCTLTSCTLLGQWQLATEHPEPVIPLLRSEVRVFCPVAGPLLPGRQPPAAGPDGQLLGGRQSAGRRRCRT